MSYIIGEEFVLEWNRIRSKVDGASGPGLHNTPTSLSHAHQPGSSDGNPLTALTRIKIANALTGTGRYSGSILYGMPNNNPTTSLMQSDLGNLSSNTVEVWNLSEIGGGGGTLQIGQYVLAVLNGFNKTSGQCIYFTTGGLISFGKMATQWNPGDTYVELTPCKSYSDGTATGAGNVHALIYGDFTTAIKPADFEGETGDIMAYVLIDSTQDPPIALLISPPTEAQGTSDYMVRRMLSGRAAYDYVQAAP